MFTRALKTLIAGTVVLFHTGAGLAQTSCEPGTPADGMPQEFSQFAFIIGDFDINYRRMTGDGWSEPLGKARWNGRLHLWQV